MAAKKSRSRKSFYEVVFNGKPKVVRAFMKGLVMGTDDEAEIYYSYNAGIHHEGKAEKIAEMVGIRGTDCHIVVDAATSALLKKKAKRIATETGLEIVSHRYVRSASMFAKYHAYARKYDDQITELIRNLPAGIKVEGQRREVKVDPTARGVEAYSVAHHFESIGEGTFSGRIDLLVALRKSLADYPLVQADDIVLNLA